MKTYHAIMILFLSIFFVSATQATIQVSSSTPVVDPNGAQETVGMIRLVFNGPEFEDSQSTAENYYVLVRIHMTDGVRLVTVGGFTPSQLSPSNYIILAFEADTGTPVFSNDPYMVRIVRFTTDYVDVLFCWNMANFTLNNLHSARFSLGLPANAVPTSANATMPAGTQASTLLVCDFSQTERDFNTDSFWEVGVTAYHSDSQGNLGIPYNASFSPARVPLAQVNQAQVGDLNLDGTLNATDLTLMANYLSHNIDLLPYIQ